MRKELPTSGFHGEWRTFSGHRVYVSCRRHFPTTRHFELAGLLAKALTKYSQENNSPVVFAELWEDDKHANQFMISIGMLDNCMEQKPEVLKIIRDIANVMSEDEEEPLYGSGDILITVFTIPQRDLNRDSFDAYEFVHLSENGETQ